MSSSSYCAMLHSGTTLVPSLRTSPALSVVSVGGLDVAIWHSTVFHSICREDVYFWPPTNDAQVVRMDCIE